MQEMKTERRTCIQPTRITLCSGVRFFFSFSLLIFVVDAYVRVSVFILLGLQRCVEMYRKCIEPAWKMISYNISKCVEPFGIIVLL